jgi:prophage regulatory protein
MEDRLLKIGDCLKIIPIGKSTFWKYVALGKLPQPVRLGTNTMWKESDLLKWMANGGPQATASR